MPIYNKKFDDKNSNVTLLKCNFAPMYNTYMITYFPNTLEMRLIFSKMSNVYISVQKKQQQQPLPFVTRARVRVQHLYYFARGSLWLVG